MSIKNLFDWTNIRHGREEMRYRLETDREFFGDDLAENMETQGILVVLEEIAASLDQTQTPCNCCGTKVRSDIVGYYAAIAIDGSITRVRKAATNLRQAATQPSEGE
jgi:hypothetical protein